jgi:hypothetical protein
MRPGGYCSQVGGGSSLSTPTGNCDYETAPIYFVPNVEGDRIYVAVAPSNCCYTVPGGLTGVDDGEAEIILAAPEPCYE